MHKIIQSHLIIESIHCMFIKGIPFLLPLSYLGLFFFFFFLAHTAGINFLGFGNRHDKTVYKTQSHSFCKLLIVTVIVTAFS